MFSNCECECDKIYAAEMSNVTDVWLYQVCFFQDLNTQKKLVFGRGSTQSQDHAGGTYDVPPDSLVSWTAGEGDTPPHTLPPRHLRRLGCQAPLTQIPATPMGTSGHVISRAITT